MLEDLAKNKLVKQVNPGKSKGFLTNNLYYQQLMANSTFCLEPPGDSPTRKGFFDALLVGCVPVIFDMRAITSIPNPPRATFDEYAVYVEDPSQTLEVLRSISKEKLALMRKA